MCENDILYTVAITWKELMNYHYIITYGYKKQLYKISLAFEAEDFAHLIGVQYLKDIAFPRYNAKKLLEKVLEHKISESMFLKSRNYKTKILPRLEALLNLQEILDNDFLLYSYFPDFYPFTTMIKADYLISSHIHPRRFIFIIKINQFNKGNVEYHCCSSFIKENRDYEINQRRRTILKKEKVNIKNNEMITLLDRLKCNQ